MASMLAWGAIVLLAQLAAAVEVPGPFRYIQLTDPSAKCLDGSPFAVERKLELTAQGGGWCYNEVDCLARAKTRLGSSITWPSEAKALHCNPATNTVNTAELFYGDGASFSGYREAAWPVPGSSETLYFRGIRNLDATLDKLLTLGLSDATRIVLTGGSAGGLSTFLHLDHVAERMKTEAPRARVVGQPVCGFFLDHGNDGYAPANVTYSLEMKYVFNMQNSTGSLARECQTAMAPDSWKCIMAPHAAKFIKTPWFALQSRFDHWQLSNELFLPCMQKQGYAPPYTPSTCTAAEDASITKYGYDFMAQFQPLIDVAGTKNGAFVDACIIHGSTNSTIDGVTNSAAFEQWYAGGQQWYLMKCGTGPNATSAGPCDKSPVCAPFP